MFCCFSSSGLALLAIWCSQPDAYSAFVNLKPQTASLVIVGLLAQFRELGGISKQPLFSLVLWV